MNLQIDGSTTPYLPTGTAAFDMAYGDVTLGLNHRFTAGRRPLLAQVYARENMNLPFQVRWNTDPDLSVGIKVDDPLAEFQVLRSRQSSVLVPCSQSVLGPWFRVRLPESSSARDRQGSASSPDEAAAWSFGGEGDIIGG